MNNLSKFMLGAMAFGLWSCSSDEPAVNPGIGETTGDFHATLTLQLPSTRSTTTDNGEPAASNTGTEVGQTSENNVDDVLVVLASSADEQTFSYVTYGYSRSSILKDEAEPTYALQFESKALAEMYGEQVYVFTYCNPSESLISYFKGLTVGATTWTDEVLNVKDDNQDGVNLWEPNKFLMTNAKLSNVTIGAGDADLDAFMANHNTPAKAFDLGTVLVERVAARFDFMGKAAEGDLAANQYVVEDLRNGDKVAIVEFTDMALFNEAKKVYYLPRVSADGFQPWTLCGNETSKNWMVGPYWEQFQELGPNPAPADFQPLQLNYLYAIGQSSMVSYDALDWTSLSKILNGTEDNHNNWTGAEGTDYRIWRYAAESLISGVNNQRQGITTGVMFKAQLKPLDNPTSEMGKVVKAAMESNHMIYALNGVMYGDEAMVLDYVTKHPVSELADVYNATMEALGEGKTLDSMNGETIAVTVNGEKTGLSIYKPAADGNYYMYYPYFNRHNSVGTNNGMEVMEFQVVRNNVYKLRVTNVLNFGKPDKPGDPDPDPDGKNDEDPEVLFRVSVQVLPWVVRVNDIEF